MVLAVRDWHRATRQTTFTGLLSRNNRHSRPLADGGQRKTEARDGLISERDGLISEEVLVAFTPIPPVGSRVIARLSGRRNDLL
jgi:hypothetical protein